MSARAFSHGAPTLPTILLAVAEQGLRAALNRAIRSGLHLVTDVKHVRAGNELVGVCVLGAAELDAATSRDVLPRLPQGARGAIADGFDGHAFDRSLDDGLGAWHALGVRLRRAYRPRKAGA